MKPTILVAAGRACRVADRLAWVLCGFTTLSPLAQAQTALADAPIFAAQSVPGNVALPLSVEYPTVQRVAHTAAYSAGAEFLGYFDPNKCYTYTYSNTDTLVRPASASAVSYFQPAGAATNHVCSAKWSGNFLNWATTHTIDPFRWGLTGGFRVVDTADLTILEKAWSTGQGSLFPDKAIAGTTLISGATPFSFANFSLRIDGLGNKMRFTGTGSLGITTATAYTGSGGTAGTTYEVFARARVCDSSGGAGGVESNCVQYGTRWKPEGLIQKYASKMRFSVFGYLNDDNNSRDGGVLRARQKFVGPTIPVPGSSPLTNSAAEWDTSTGVFIVNPDIADATATNTAFAPSVSVVNSGVMNYVNKFGEIAPTTGYTFKSHDPVSELYYTAVRYFKNQGSVPEYSSMAGATAATKSTWVDGFPVITNWNDPIQYSCQRNFILGIGDIYTHADKNLPGSGTGASLEPTKPPLVLADTTVNAVTSTNKAFALQGLTAPDWNNYSGRNNSAGMVGLAYDSHTKDIRADLAGTQTIDTYWVDVLENPFVANNQFYLAAKYGGFTMPAGYDSYTNTTALADSSWHTATGSPDTNLVGTQLRPDNYFTGGKPDLMIAGLNSAFSRISAQLTAYTTSFATSLPQVTLSGNSSYSSLYDANNWTGEIKASSLSFDATTGDPSVVVAWSFTDKLAAQLAAAGSYLSNRRMVTWGGSSGVQFCSGTAGCTVPITPTQLTALDPSYVTGDDSANYLKYLRGDTTNEQGSASGTKAYRTRAKLLGDIVGSKARPVGPPSFPFSDATNPGYAAFKTTWASRPTVVYVGANDGMMHAIRGDLTGTSAGVELFAYVPNALFQGPNSTPSVDGLASLGNPSFVHHFMVNATPNVYDVDFSRTVGASGAPNWRSILIGGLGKGGRSYYAIDVTDPIGMASGGEATVAGKVLWEFTDAADLGYTYGDPIVVKTSKYGWVVIIPSGYNNTDGKGYFFILNPRTGALLEKISTNAGSPTNSAGLAFANAFVLDGTDGTVDAVYAGDLLGNLWRWDVSGTGTYPAPLRMATLTDGTNPQPVTSRPLIEVHPSLKRRFVLVGTGRLLDNSDISTTQVQSFYAIVDGTNAKFNTVADLPPSVANFPITRSMLAANTNALTGITYDPTTQMGWFEDLGTGTGGIGWRVTSDATTLLGSVAWAATLPNGSVCNPSGDSRVYGRDFGTAITTINTDVSGTLSPVSYISIAGMVTDLRYLSVNGKATLISGTDTGNLQKIAINPLTGLGLRRLNWRELQTVE